MSDDIPARRTPEPDLVDQLPLSGPCSEHRDLLARLVVSLTSAWAAAWALFWFLGSYLEMNLFAVTSYKGADQPIVDPPYRIGVHTFGDYLQPWTWVQQPDPWTDITPPPNYPPLAMVLFEPFGAVSARSGLAPYLALLLIALLTPFVWATWRSSWLVRTAAIGGALLTVPVTVTMDRGNQIGLVVPFLLLFAVGVATHDDRRALLGLIGATCLKVYPALIGIALIRRRPLRNGAIAAVVTLAVTGGIWALYPAGIRPNLTAWADAVVGFSSDDRADPLQPGWNYSLTGGLTLVLGGGSRLGTWITGHPWVPGVGFLIGTVWVVFRSARPTLMSISLVLACTQLVVPVSARYTTVFALVVVALLIRDVIEVQQAKLLLLPQGRLANARTLVWISVMTLTLVPIPLVSPEGVLVTPALLAALWIGVLGLELLANDRGGPNHSMAQTGSVVPKRETGGARSASTRPPSERQLDCRDVAETHLQRARIRPEGAR